MPQALLQNRGGFCRKCQSFIKESRKDNFKRHFVKCSGPATPSPAGDLPIHPTCNICGRTFQRRDVYLKHLCKRQPASPNAAKYKLTDSNGALKGVFGALNILQKYELCFHQKLCVASFWPPIMPDQGGIRQMDYHLYGNPVGKRLLSKHFHITQIKFQ